MENNQNEITKKKKHYAISAAMLLVTTVVLVQPMQTSYAVDVEEVTKYDSCVRRTGGNAPEDPISMNTVLVNVNKHGIAKTIHAEKEVYDCETVQGGLPVIVDVTIIAEIYENMTTQQIVRKQVEVVTCMKQAAGAVLIGCSSGSIPTIPVAVGTNCSEEFIPHPQEMNTVSKRKIAKTIEAQKEIFECDFNDVEKKVDIVLFTEIYEDLSTQETIDIQFLSARCVVLRTDNGGDLQDAFVESCIFTEIPN